MNKICETCDARIRLKLCNGRDEDFKYCYRPIGKINANEKNIQSFNNIEEVTLLNDIDFKGNFHQVIDRSTIQIEPYVGDHLMLMTAKYLPELWDKYGYGSERFPVGWIMC